MRIFARIYPKFLRKKINNLLICSDVKIKLEEFISFVFMFSFGLALIVSLFVSLYTSFNFLIFMGIFLGTQIIFYFIIFLNADKKAKFVDSILPDCLQLTASNLKAGFTTERAFLLTSRPEFGSFSDELTLLAKKIAGGKNLDEAMLDMTKRIKSDKFSRAINLIIFGIKSGGELAELLDQTAQNLRNQEIIEERVRASVSMYFIFIFITVCFAAPLLFGLSSFMSEVITSQIAKIEMPENIASPITIGVPEVEPGFVMTFVIVLLVIMSVFGSLILGIVNKGEIKEGIKFMPVILGCSLGTFFVVRLLIKMLFSFLL